MKTLLRHKEILNFKFLYSLGIRLVYGVMIVFYIATLMDDEFKYQVAYIGIFIITSTIFEYLSANKKQSAEIEIVDDSFQLLGVSIKLSTVNEILYSQHKRFEHTIRFRFSNDTYQDFELSASDLIQDLRFYHFLVENKLPVKMLDNDDRIS